jgi:mannan endo-1,4-beta-mannosidase
VAKWQSGVVAAGGLFGNCKGFLRKFYEFLGKHLVVSKIICTFATDMKKGLRTIRNNVVLVLLAALLITACGRTVNESASDFVTVENGHFVKNGKPYYYVGTNFWYGAILASEGQGGDRERLAKELDLMKEMGIDNLRVLVGSDGQRGVKTKVEPTLQEAPGVYNDTILAGLDYLLQEMGKRDMVAVLYLNNSWEWSGGYGFYLEQAGAGPQPRPDDVGYPAFMQAMAQYATNEKAHQLFYDYVRFIITRTNRYTGKAYKDDPAIMSWQIGNEPRAFSKEALPAFEKWLAEASALIRELDPNHLISIGSEGAWGCEGDFDCWERITSDKNIDYANIHLWPYNWGWAKPDSLIENLPRAQANTKEYIDRHLDICDRIGKPLVMEEFGYPRDGFKFAKDIPTKGRDGFYQYVFSLVADNAEQGGRFAGCNFWGWGGLAEPKHEQWQVGDDYTGDPAQEAQGLNSVFATDSTTLAVVRSQVDRMSKLTE